VTQLPVYRTIREQIADHLRADILSGRLSPGTNLREQALAQQYGVSRAPVRDALLMLTQEGLLVARPNCGVKVGGAASEGIQPLVVDLRRRIEEFALRECFDNLAEADVERLEQIVEELRTACMRGELADIVRLDMTFHRRLLEATGNGDLVAMWLPIVSRMMLQYTRHGDWMESHREHAAIVEAIRRKDKRAALEALVANIQ